MPSKRQSLLMDALALSGPLLVVVGVRALMAPAPSSAKQPVTGGTAMSPVVLPVGNDSLTTEQKRAQDWLSALGPIAGVESPMDHPIAAPPPPPPDIKPPPIEPVIVTPEDPLAGLKFNGLIGNDGSGLAAINGKIYKVGDEVRKGVTLTRIDPRAYSIILTLPDGTERTLRRTPQK